MVPICISLQNPLRTKLTMEDKGKVVTIKTDEEEMDLEELMVAENVEEGMGKEAKPVPLSTKLPAYIPLQKGKAKVPKDIDETKSSLQTPLLPDNIILEGTHLGQVLGLKFED